MELSKELPNPSLELGSGILKVGWEGRLREAAAGLGRCGEICCIAAAAVLTSRDLQ